jgi:tRNA pseudouridine55 synthase
MDFGFICVNKPTGVSSFDVVRQLKKVSSTPKIGHAGTLDPFAEGLMICAVGRQFTRQIDHFQGLEKGYRFSMTFGSETDTLDPTGNITINHIHKSSLSKMSSDPNLQTQFRSHLSDVLEQFRGDIQQFPPSFSAKKINGKRAYKLARKGEQVILDPVTVSINDIQLDSVTFDEFPCATIFIRCSKGTYVRSLVRDIGRALGYYATTTWLVRESIGPYLKEQAVGLNELDLSNFKSHLFCSKK